MECQFILEINHSEQIVVNHKHEKLFNNKFHEMRNLESRLLLLFLKLFISITSHSLHYCSHKIF